VLCNSYIVEWEITINIYIIYVTCNIVFAGTARFFLRGTLKNVVYQEVPTTPENMKQGIIEACATISPQVLRSVRFWN